MQKLFNYSEKPQAFEVKEHDTPEMGKVNDFKKDNAYFFSNLTQPKYWEEERRFNSRAFLYEAQLPEGQVAFCVQSQSISSKFEQTVDQSAFYTLGRDEEETPRLELQVNKESLAQKIRKLRNISVTPMEKDISPEFAT